MRLGRKFGQGREQAQQVLVVKRVCSRQRTIHGTDAVAGKDGVYRSSDGAKSWTKVRPGEIRDLAVDLTKPARLYVATKEGLYRSADSGATWSKAPGIKSDDVEAVVVSPSDGKVFTATFDGVFISADGGDTWKAMNDGLRAGGLIPANEPFTGLGFAHVLEPPVPAVAASVFNPTTPVFNSIVDWVFVELRSTLNPAQVVQTRSGLIIRPSGSVILISGNFEPAMTCRFVTAKSPGMCDPRMMTPEPVSSTSPRVLERCTASM